MSVDPRCLVLVALHGIQGSEDVGTVTPCPLLPAAVTVHRDGLTHRLYFPLPHLHHPPPSLGGGALEAGGATGCCLLFTWEVRGALKGLEGEIKSLSCLLDKPVVT